MIIVSGDFITPKAIINLRMKRACFLFHDELDELLPLHQRGHSFTYEFNGAQSIKHLIEALGVPHTEIGRMLVNDCPVDTSYQVQEADRVEVYPARVDSSEADLQSDGQGEFKFILDNHLGRLAAYLRMLGFDVRYHNDFQDVQLAEISEQDGRILLTRDRRLLMRKQVSSGYCVRKLDPPEQLKEVIKRFGLKRYARPFRRCIRCNSILEPVRKEQVLERLEPLTRQYYDEFRVCPDCQQIYWKGSHFERMEQLIRAVLENQDD
jgi:uncharacterized protein with PIN domain